MATETMSHPAGKHRSSAANFYPEPQPASVLRPPSPLCPAPPPRFDPSSLEGEEQYLLLGLLLGLAVYNRVLLDFPLPLALYKKLLGLPVGLRELEEMQPTFGRSLRQLLQVGGGQGERGGINSYSPVRPDPPSPFEILLVHPQPPKVV